MLDESYALIVLMQKVKSDIAVCKKKNPNYVIGVFIFF